MNEPSACVIDDRYKTTLPPLYNTGSGKIAAKLLLAISKMGAVFKDGSNTFHGYRYASESAIMDAVRPVLLEQGLAVFTSLETYTVDTVPAKGRDDHRVTCTYLHTFVDQDSGDIFQVRSFGQGIDSGDKAGYKAATGAMKYFLNKNFMVSFSDDPEATSYEEDNRREEAPPKRKEQVEPPPKQTIMQEGERTPMSKNKSEPVPAAPQAPLGGRPANEQEALKLKESIDTKNQVLGDLEVDIQKFGLTVKQVLDYMRERGVIKTPIEDLNDIPLELFRSLKAQYQSKVIPMLQKLSGK